MMCLQRYDTESSLIYCSVHFSNTTIQHHLRLHGYNGVGAVHYLQAARR